MAQDTVARVLEELDKIYSEENLQKDKFFKELIEQHPEGCKHLKNPFTLSKIGLKLPNK